MAKYPDSKVYVTFKKVFGEHTNLVISLLGVLFPLDEGKKAESVKYLSPEIKGCKRIHTLRAMTFIAQSYAKTPRGAFANGAIPPPHSLTVPGRRTSRPLRITFFGRISHLGLRKSSGVRDLMS